MFNTALFTPKNILIIAVMAFIGIIVINAVLRQAGMTQYQA